MDKDTLGTYSTGHTKTKTTKKQKVGCRIGDLAKNKNKQNTPKSNTKIKTKVIISSAMQDFNKHHPVLLTEVLTYLNPQPGESFLDLTAGYGGHSAEILDRTLKPHHTTLVDRDENAVAQLNQRFAGQGVRIIHSDFLSASQRLVDEGAQYDLILADLGVSSPHLDNASRG